MSIDDLDLVPELTDATGTDQFDGEGLLPCSIFTTCFFIASRVTDTWL